MAETYVNKRIGVVDTDKPDTLIQAVYDSEDASLIACAEKLPVRELTELLSLLVDKRIAIGPMNTPFQGLEVYTILPHGEKKSLGRMESFKIERDGGGGVSARTLHDKGFGSLVSFLTEYNWNIVIDRPQHPNYRLVEYFKPATLVSSLWVD